MSVKIKRAENSFFYLGRRKVDTVGGEPGSLLIPVSEFIIHPEWNATDESYDADLAIALLATKFEYSRFIKPICIWRETNYYSDIVGKKGRIAGWGKTDNSSVSHSTPKWTDVSVVDAETCLRSDSVFVTITSKRMFCAGNRDSSKGPCNGDSVKF